jgi:hypothetical protein
VCLVHGKRNQLQRGYAVGAPGDDL